MKPTQINPDDSGELLQYAALMAEYLDVDWYRTRFPEIGGNDLDPYQHFVRYGAVEKRDPNPFFNGAWYLEHYPDVAASGTSPLLHYIQSGAAELRNPHPRFDAVYYVEQHPEAAASPLLFHLRIGRARGFQTERPVDIRDYLPSADAALPLQAKVFADVIILIDRRPEAARRCVQSVLSDRAFPLARIIVVDDRSAPPELITWLRGLAAEGHIHLISNRHRLGFAASAALGVTAAERHDVVLLSSSLEVPAAWLRRLAAHAYRRPNIATVSPFSDYFSIGGDARAGSPPSATEELDAVCQTVNRGRSTALPASVGDCIYIRRSALLAVGTHGLPAFGTDAAVAGGFCARASAAGWQHRLACDTYLQSHIDVPRPGRHQRVSPREVAPFQFAVAASLFRSSGLPVILMISHNLGGGVRRHVEALAQRYRDAARILLLEGTDRGAALSLASSPDHPVLTLPADRLDDLVAVLSSAGLSRIHIHHLLQMDMDIRSLIRKLGVKFDVTMHDYYAICPQINLLTWPEGFYCGEPGPAACNACIAERVSHGARDIISWRADHAWQFLDADRVICPSADVKTRLDRYGLGERAIVVPHEQRTIDPVRTTRIPLISKPPLRIVLLGVLANHKGARTVVEVAALAPPGTIDLQLIGHLEDDFPEPSAKLIRVTGKYQETELPELLRRSNPHILWFPATWPETWSYTLSSAIDTGLPIVASDIGSFSERLAGRPQSFLVDHRASAQEWLATFDAVRAALEKRAAHDTCATHDARVTHDRCVQDSCVIHGNCGTQDSRVTRLPVRHAGGASDFYADRYLALPPVIPVARSRKPLIAIVPERSRGGGLTPSAYIRLLQPMDHLATRSGCDMITVDVEAIFSCDADLIITQRHAVADADLANRLAGHARRTGARLVYDLDEDLLNIPGTHPDAVRLRPFAKSVRRMLTVADAVWVATPKLAQRLASARPDTTLIETRLDERIWVRPAPSPFWDDPIRILCMGPITHEGDFGMIEPALLRLKDEYRDRIVIDILGMTGRSELPAGLNRSRLSAHASRSYPGLVNWLTTRQPRWHIGLAPLRDTPSNGSQSPVQAMDYAAMAMTVLASDTPVHRGSIADGAAGQLVPNDPHAWHAALDWLIRNQPLRAAGAVSARSAFLAQGSLASHAEVRLAALEQMLPGRILDQDFNLRVGPAALTIDNDPIVPATRKRRHSRRGR